MWPWLVVHYRILKLIGSLEALKTRMETQPACREHPSRLGRHLNEIAPKSIQNETPFKKKIENAPNLPENVEACSAV